MKKIFLFSTFVFGNLTILFLSLLVLTIRTTKQSAAGQYVTPTTVGSEDSPNFATLTVQSGIQQAEIIAGDASERLVEAFFKKYNSPMVGTGKDVVTAARKYQIPYGLLPAIGQCEGNLGKTIPAGSFNTWGFGIYGGQITRFSSWQEAIDTVSKAMRRDYFDFGMTTPEAMMAKYAPPSNGSWAFCVNKFLAELTNP